MAELDACGGEAASDEMPRGRGRAYNKYDGMFLKDAAMAARLANASGVTAKFEGGVLSVKMCTRCCLARQTHRWRRS